MNPPTLPPYDGPPELLTQYSREHLAQALITRIIGDAVALGEIIMDPRFQPCPKQSAELLAEMEAVLDTGAPLLREGWKFIADMKELTTRAAGVQVRAIRFADDVRDIQQTIEDSPRG